MPVPRCAVAPHDAGHAQALRAAVVDAGGQLCSVEDANAVIWTDPSSATGLDTALRTNPDIAWVALPFAGIEPFLGLLDHERAWTCGKGVYADPVAEHALGLALAGMRNIGSYARAAQWSGPHGTNLLGANVTIVGGGEICRSLIRLLAGFDTQITVVRNRPEPLEGVARVVTQHELHAALSTADLVVLALALTEQTRGLVGREALAAMRSSAWLVNVARGAHIDTQALVSALKDGTIAGAALDVTDPEPLPADHALWTMDNVVITPHVGNTPDMARILLADRVRENVRRFAAGDDLLGPVHVELGY